MLYALLAGDDPDKYWAQFEKNFEFSAEFKSLFVCMCAEKAEERLSASEIKSHPWVFQKHAADQARIFEEFNKRHAKLAEEAQKVRNLHQLEA